MIRRQSLLSALLCALLAAPACHKQINVSISSRQDLISKAQLAIDSLAGRKQPVNYRAAQPKTIQWDASTVVQINGAPALLAPIVFKNSLLVKANFSGKDLFHLDYLSKVLYYADSSGKGNIVVITDFPDSACFRNPSGPFTGIQFVEDWYGNPIEKLLYTANGQIRRYVPSNSRAAAVDIIQTCYSIDGYNYSPETGETYAWSESAGCTVQYIESGTTGGGSIGGILPPSSGPAAGGKVGTTATVTVLPGNSVIKSIQAYFQCFTNVGGSDHHYTVTVAVAQPVAGTRTPWTTSGSGSSGSSGGGNPVNAGHVFLILTESYAGTTITRNVGFYPSGSVNPVNNASQGSLNDDETHAFNISGTFTVDNAQFFNVLNYVSQGNNAGYLYNLNTNNCTTFAINAMAQAGITLPRTTGTWVDGAGNNPGDLGQDLRLNQIPGMTLNLTGGTNYSHFNAGQCN